MCFIFYCMHLKKGEGWSFGTGILVEGWRQRVQKRKVTKDTHVHAHTASNYICMLEGHYWSTTNYLLTPTCNNHSVGSTIEMLRSFKNVIFAQNIPYFPLWRGGGWEQKFFLNHFNSTRQVFKIIHFISNLKHDWS